MFQGVRSKLDLYIDTAAQVGTQVINNPKSGPITGAFSLSVWYADIAGAAGAVSGILGAVGAGVMVWVTVERWLFDRKIKREELKNKRLENESLQQLMRKRGGR